MEGRKDIFLDQYFQFGNVIDGSTGVQRVVGLEMIVFYFSLISGHNFWLMAPDQTTDAQTLVGRTELPQQLYQD